MQCGAKHRCDGKAKVLNAARMIKLKAVGTKVVAVYPICVAPSWDVYAYYIYTSAAVLQSTTRNMNCDRAVVDKLPNTAFLDTIIGMQNGTIPSMFVGATVLPITFDTKLNEKYKCVKGGCYKNVATVFYGEKNADSHLQACIGFGHLKGSGGMWLEHSWLMTNSGKCVDVTIDTFSHVFGFVIGDDARITAAAQLHTYAMPVKK